VQLKRGRDEAQFGMVGAMRATTAVVCFFSIAIINGQASPQGGAQAVSTEKPLMAEQAFQDVQLLRGISVKEFMETMGFFSAATNGNCTHCHGA
jgi:hypothetical protein